MKTRGAWLTTSGLGRANTNFRRLLSARPPSTAISISHATPGLRSRNRYTAAAKVIIKKYSDAAETCHVPRRFLQPWRADWDGLFGRFSQGKDDAAIKARLRVATPTAMNPNRKRRAAIVKREASAIAPSIVRLTDVGQWP